MIAPSSWVHGTTLNS